MLRMVLIVDLWMLLQTENGLQLQLQGTGLGKRLLCLMAIARRNAVATSSAATIPVAEVLRIAGTNADANELPPD